MPAEDMPAGNMPMPTGDMPADDMSAGGGDMPMPTGDMPAENSNPSGSTPVEFEYNHNWNFDNFDLIDSVVPESEDETTSLMDEMDVEDSEGGETSGFYSEDSGIELPNGVTINPFNEDGDSDLSIAAPIMNVDGSTIGELDISFPEYVEDYFSSVFNLDEIQEFNSNDESIISNIQDDFSSLFGVDAPVLGEDNLLQLPGGFEIDLSEIIGDSGEGESAT